MKTVVNCLAIGIFAGVTFCSGWLYGQSGAYQSDGHLSDN